MPQIAQQNKPGLDQQVGGVPEGQRHRSAIFQILTLGCYQHLNTFGGDMRAPLSGAAPLGGNAMPIAATSQSWWMVSLSHPATNSAPGSLFSDAATNSPCAQQLPTKPRLTTTPRR